MCWFRCSVDNPELLLGIVHATGVRVRPSSLELLALMGEVVAQAKQSGIPEEVRSAIRRLIRRGGFKPSGRNKPASEFLLRAARDDCWPKVNNVVDINNLVSLRFGWPCSVVDTSMVVGEPVLRLGREGERYVFNRAGQEIELRGLVCLADEQGAFANPVKDSMRTKTSESTRELVVVTFTSLECAGEESVLRWGEQTGELLRRFARAEAVSHEVIRANIE